MGRSGSTWKSYLRLMAWVASLYGVDHTATVDSAQADDALLSRLVRDLKGGAVDYAAVEAGTGISSKHLTHHVRYIARWGGVRRSLLAGGGNFQLLEKLGKDLKREGMDENTALSGLALEGKLVEQRRQLAEHLEGELATPQGRGWLRPNPQTRRQVRLYRNEPAWVYNRNEIGFIEGLHPAVARSLIARYVKGPGVVIDPMAGSGMVAEVATSLGHRVWASDVKPEREFIFEFDLKGDLNRIMGEEARVSADLLILHPPQRNTLKFWDEIDDSDEGYLDWLREILDGTASAVRQGGHLALIVPLGVDLALLGQIQMVLRLSIQQEFNSEELPELTANHLAVSRDGQEGWHLLVTQVPGIEEEPQPLS